MEDADPLMQCLRNPSGLLVQGPLQRALHPALEQPLEAEVRIESQVLPVLWNAAWPAALRASPGFDAVFALGVRSADPEPEIYVEAGALNLRGEGADASGRRLSGPIDPARPEGAELRAPAPADMPSQHGRYRIALVQPRATNAYICNETYYRLLQLAQQNDGPRRVRFLHTPRLQNEAASPAGQRELNELAAAVAACIAAELRAHERV